MTGRIVAVYGNMVIAETTGRVVQNSTAFCCRSDGARLLSSADDGSIRVWAAKEAQAATVLQGHRGGVLSVAVSSDDKLAISGGRDGTVRVWDLGKGELLHTHRRHRNWVEAVAFAGGSGRVLSGGRDGRILKWDLERGEVLGEIRHEGWVRALVCTPDAEAASAVVEDTTTCWDLATGVQTGSFRGHEGPVLSLALTPDGSRLISASADATLLVWKLP